jgi:hypothetical protein
VAEGREPEGIDLALRQALRGVPEPRLSPFFDRRLETRLAGERRRKRQRRRWRRVLQAYWLLAASASGVIVLQLGGRSFAAAPVLLGTLACGVILPGVLLLVALRKDPIELVFETLDWLG